MKKVLLFGAGKSATCLIDYLIEQAQLQNWQVTIADVNRDLVEAKTGKAGCTIASAVDIADEISRNALIEVADIVISLLPPALHYLVAASCLQFSKNLLTASYVDPRIYELQEEVTRKGLLFLGEMGLDPGIDHMSAMALIQEIRASGREITAFRSHCGGLVAPESDDNPWHYKISWNPRNVVLAGKAGATYKEAGEVVSIPARSIFSNTETVAVPGLQPLAWYANRDSLGYIPVYGLEKAGDFIRTTLRHPSFRKGWRLLSLLDLTDTEDEKDFAGRSNVSNWFQGKLELLQPGANAWEQFLLKTVTASFREEFTDMCSFLDLFSTRPIPQQCTCSADMLQFLLEEKLVLHPQDRDMVVMVHELETRLGEARQLVTSSLVVKGTDNARTAMAKTVGLPLGIATNLLLNGTISLSGVHIPVMPEIYVPVLAELRKHGIFFEETLIDLPDA